MEAGAWECARLVRDEPPPDVVACSDYVDLPRLMGLLPPSWRRVPTICYFHENQWCYPHDPDATTPDREGRADRNASYGFSNALTAIRTEALVFNSEHHRSSFADAGAEWLRRLPKPNPARELRAAIEESHVVPPLPELEAIELGPGSEPGAALRIVFPHRLEADKRPVVFARSIARCVDAGARIEVVFTGGRPGSLRPEVEQALGSISRATVSVGYIESRRDYLEVLRRADVVASTAAHEFFGVAFAEAMAAGCSPLAPAAENYPALLRAYHGTGTGGRAGLFESEDDLTRRIMALSGDPEPLRAHGCRRASRRTILPFDAKAHVGTLDDLVEQVVRESS